VACDILHALSHAPLTAGCRQVDSWGSSCLAGSLNGALEADTSPVRHQFSR
jgi:hypothetical protein